MITMHLTRFAPVLLAAAFLASPVSSFADRKVTVYRDNDHDGHYNKKTYSVPDHYYGHNDGHYGYGYGRGYYPHGYGYGYRPYYGYGGYGYGYGYPGYYYPHAGITLNFSSRPYYYPQTVYRGYTYSDSLALDVQRALRRHGYYHGGIDGDVGPQTRAAIRSYQYDRGMAVTGRIDTSLLRALGIG